MRTYVLFLGGIAGLVVAGCGGGTQAKTPNSGSQAVPITTAAVSQISIQRRVEVAGTLTSPDQARVSSEVAGIVREVPVELGSRVRAGDVLVRLEPRELALALERSESALRQTEAQLGIADGRPIPADDKIAAVQQATATRDDARAAFARAEQLNTRGLLPKADRDTAETRVKVAEATLTATLDTIHSLKASLQDRKAAMDLAQKKLNDAVIKAPIEGAIAERLVQTGEFIRENTPVVTIVRVTPLKLRTAIQERYADLIKPGQAVQFTVEAFPNRTFAGKVAYVGPAVDQATRTFPIEAVVENTSGELKPGFFAKATVGTRLDDHVLAVPEDAVLTMAGVTTAYVVENGKVRQQAVVLGEHVGNLVEIVEGLKGPETLAASNLNMLATGTAVKSDRGGKPEAARTSAPAGGTR